MLSTDVLRLIAAARSAASTDVGTTMLRVGIGSARFFRQGRKQSRCQRLLPQSPRILCRLAEAAHVTRVDGATYMPMERLPRRDLFARIPTLPLRRCPHTLPVHVPTECRPLDARRRPLTNNRKPNSCVSGLQSFGLLHATSYGEGCTRKSQPVSYGGVHERDNEKEFQHQDNGPHSRS